MKNQQLQSKMSKMRNIKIEKLTLNIGAGKSVDVLEKGVKLIKNLTGIKPVKTKTQKRIPTWSLRPGLPIGCKVTLRRDAAKNFFKQALTAKDNILKKTNVDNEGNVSFGVPEYILMENTKYDPEIGIMGFQVCLTLERPGYRIKKRRLLKRKIPKKHKITKEEAIDFISKTFEAEFSEEK